MLRRLGFQSVITSDPGAIREADKIILPGVGAFDNGMKNIRAKGLETLLNDKALVERVPVLGICLGMQLLSDGSEEGIEPGLGWVPGKAIKFRFESGHSALKVPHMGWNDVCVNDESHALVKGFLPEMRFYFVHSYHVVCTNPKDVLMTVDFGGPVVAAVSRGNIMGTQFHPEKSHKFGMLLLKNFAEM
jgi:glutamine amidotransferase